MGRWTEVESGALWLEAEKMDPHEARLGTGRHETDPLHCRGPTVDEPEGLRGTSRGRADELAGFGRGGLRGTQET